MMCARISAFLDRIGYYLTFKEHDNECVLQSPVYPGQNSPGPVADFLLLFPIIFITILFTDVFLNNIPSIPNRYMETARSPEMLTTPFFQIAI